MLIFCNKSLDKSTLWKPYYHVHCINAIVTGIKPKLEVINIQVAPDGSSPLTKYQYEKMYSNHACRRTSGRTN